MQVAVAVLLLVPGLAFPLLLNGQEFTNSLVAMVCALGAVALVLGPMIRRRGTRRSTPVGGKFVLGLGLLLTVGLAVHLPTAYRVQSQFNRRMQELRRPRATGAPAGALRLPADASKLGPRLSSPYLPGSGSA